MADNKQYKSGFVNLIGRPNVGKSTLMNRLIGQKIAITSSKPQTTRNRIQTVYTDERGQVVFLDTPGIHKSKNKLGEYMVNVAERTINEVDVVLWLVEPTDYIGAGEQHIIEKLKKCKTPVILVINKIDKVTNDELLHFIDVYRTQMDFAEVVPVSALKGKNTDELLKCIFNYLPYGDPFYDEDTVTDQPVRQIVAEIIREKALRLLDEEIPHGVAVSIDQMKYTDRICNIDATIVCERDSHKGIIIGKGGAMLKKIGTKAREDIEKLVEMQVNLKLWVKVKKDWRDSDFLMKNFGYDPKEKLGGVKMIDLIPVTGIILKAEPIGEYDRRVVILTKERGKISAFAKGARKQTSTLLAATAPFSFGVFKIYEGRSSYTLSEAKIENYFEEFRTAMQEAFYGMYFLEIADYYTRENNDEKEMLKLLYASLSALLKKRWSPAFVRCVYELKAIAVNGEYPGAPEGNWNESTVYALNFIGETPVENLYTFTVKDEVLNEMIKISEMYCKRYMDKKFKSVALLEDVRYNI